MSEERGDMIPSTNPVQTMQAADPGQAMLFDPSQPRKLSWCSWDRTTEDGYLLISRIGADAKKPLKECVNLEIEVEHVYVQPNEAQPDAQGEVQVYPWICLVAPDGQLYSCGSHGVFASLSEALQFRPKLPWKPPLRFRVVQLQLKNARTMLKLLGIKGKPIEVQAEERNGKVKK